MTSISRTYGQFVGTSTGTGAEQTIAHTLGYEPIAVYVYIPSTGELGGCDADATYIYPNVPSGVVYYYTVVYRATSR